MQPSGSRINQCFDERFVLVLSVRGPAICSVCYMPVELVCYGRIAARFARLLVAAIYTLAAGGLLAQLVRSSLLHLSAVLRAA